MPTRFLSPINQYRQMGLLSSVPQDIDQFRNDLNNIAFVRSPEGTAAELYDQYITGVTQVLDKHAPAKQQSDEWLSDSYRMARSLRQQFEGRWRKHKSRVQQVKTPQANCLV